MSRQHHRPTNGSSRLILCAGCGQKFHLSHFSQSQIRNKGRRRRCRQCVSENRRIPKKKSASASLSRFSAVLGKDSDTDPSLEMIDPSLLGGFPTSSSSSSATEHLLRTTPVPVPVPDPAVYPPLEDSFSAYVSGFDDPGTEESTSSDPGFIPQHPFLLPEILNLICMYLHPLDMLVLYAVSSELGELIDELLLMPQQRGENEQWQLQLRSFLTCANCRSVQDAVNLYNSKSIPTGLIWHKVSEGAYSSPSFDTSFKILPLRDRSSYVFTFELRCDRGAGGGFPMSILKGQTCTGTFPGMYSWKGKYRQRGSTFSVWPDWIPCSGMLLRKKEDCKDEDHQNQISWWIWTKSGLKEQALPAALVDS